MFVHTIETTFMRKRKPADYEGVDNSLTLGATLTEGEDWRACARELVDEAAVIVYTRIGMKDAAKPVFSTSTLIENGIAKVVVQEAAAPVSPSPAAVVNTGAADPVEQPAGSVGALGVCGARLAAR